jgi:hypothetical protein
MTTIQKGEEKRTTFPMLPVSQWWRIRSLFKRSIPGIVTDSYLVAALNIKQVSAQTNIIPSLRLLKLIDDTGKTTALAKDWRDDQKYPEVCQKLREEIYPKELFDAFPNPLNDRDGVKRWFAHITGNGETAVKKIVALFFVLVEAKPDVDQIKEPRTKNSEKNISKKKDSSRKKNDKPKENFEAVMPETKQNKRDPEVCINLQIHISPDATADQIDKIFESIAKHLYKDK